MTLLLGRIFLRKTLSNFVVNRPLKLRANGRNVVGCCWMLLRVVVSCCRKFETGQSFSPVQTDAKLLEVVASVCS